MHVHSVRRPNRAKRTPCWDLSSFSKEVRPQASVASGQPGNSVQRAPSQEQPLPEQPPWVRQTVNRTCSQQTSNLSAVVVCRTQQSLHASW